MTTQQPEALRRVIKDDEALLRWALEKLEDLSVAIDCERGKCRELEQIDADGDQWPIVIALRERLE